MEYLHMITKLDYNINLKRINLMLLFIDYFDFID